MKNLNRILFAITLIFYCNYASAQEPTKEEWIAAFRSRKTDNKQLVELERAHREVLDGKIQSGASTRYDNGWVFGSKREKQAKLDKAKGDLITEKRRLWNDKSSRYPQVDAYSLKKGDLGIIVTSLSELTNRRPAPSSDVSAFLAQANEMATKVQSYKVLQVLGGKEFLCNCGKTTILVSGVDTTDLRDDKSIERLGLMYCVGNSTYPTANGTKTVMKVVPISNEVADKLAAETVSELTVSRVRTWTDVTGKHKTEAELIDYDGKKVTIKKTDGTQSVLPVSKISKADRDYVEAELGAPEK